MTTTWKDLRSEFNISEEDENIIDLEKELIKTMVKIRSTIDVRIDVRYNEIILGGLIMNTINVTNARQRLYQLITDVNLNREPITIMNNRGKNAVLISEDDWNAIQETNYINSVPELAQKIIAGAAAPIEECIPEDEVQW